LPTPSSPDVERLLEIAASASDLDGQPPFSDQSLVELRTGSRTALVLADVAAAIVGTGEAEFVVAPDARGRRHGTALLERLVADAADELLIWAHGDHPAARALARSHGFDPVRELLQLRAPVEGREGDSAVRSVAVTDSGRSAAAGSGSGSGSDSGSGSGSGSGSSFGSGSRSGISTFRPGDDDAAWLHVNARAFAHHPEQGRVSQRDLDELRTEDWFNPEDFLVVRDGTDIVAYCWLKVEGGMGEFYVVGVDPSRQGEGLGRRLMDAGFARLAARGIRTALLYVEGDNAPALALYRSYGFERHSIDIQYALRR
jgi:mycothiol synthase